MNKKEIIKLLGTSEIDYDNNTISIAIWHDKFSDYVNYYNEHLCDLIDFNINFEGVEENSINCQNNVLLLNSLKSNTIINISTFYGLGEIILENLKDVKCTIHLHMINIIFNNNDNHKYNNIMWYPMIDNNYYTDENVKINCSNNNIKVIDYNI